MPWIWGKKIEKVIVKWLTIADFFCGKTFFYLILWLFSQFSAHPDKFLTFLIIYKVLRQIYQLFWRLFIIFENFTVFQINSWLFRKTYKLFRKFLIIFESFSAIPQIFREIFQPYQRLSKVFQINLWLFRVFQQIFLAFHIILDNFPALPKNS